MDATPATRVTGAVLTDADAPLPRSGRDDTENARLTPRRMRQWPCVSSARHGADLYLRLAAVRVDTRVSRIPRIAVSDPSSDW
jgi:ABC-type Fe2+-enterobactin transport system substrate-binding protein